MSYLLLYSKHNQPNLFSLIKKNKNVILYETRAKI